MIDAKPQAIERGSDGLTLTRRAPATGSRGVARALVASLAGVLSVGAQGFTRSPRFQVRASPGATGMGPPPAKTEGRGDLGLAAAAVFALMGGLILNLMPCVFPILAMKAASLAGHGGERTAARRQGLAFGAGSVLTFVALAGGLIALKAAGSAVGWGFQLQSPPVVAVLALLMLAVALNPSGVFEVGTSIARAPVRASLAEAASLAPFFTGALAVVVAAPCTAPFMGPALGWALTQTPAAALAVFTGVGHRFCRTLRACRFCTWPALASAASGAVDGRVPQGVGLSDVWRSRMACLGVGPAGRRR